MFCCFGKRPSSSKHQMPPLKQPGNISEFVPASMPNSRPPMAPLYPLPSEPKQQQQQSFHIISKRSIEDESLSQELVVSPDSKDPASQLNCNISAYGQSRPSTIRRTNSSLKITDQSNSPSSMSCLDSQQAWIGADYEESLMEQGHNLFNKTADINKAEKLATQCLRLRQIQKQVSRQLKSLVPHPHVLHQCATTFYSKFNLLEDEPDDIADSVFKLPPMPQDILQVNNDLSKCLLQTPFPDLEKALNIFEKMTAQQKNSTDSKGIRPVYLVTALAIKFQQRFLEFAKNIFYSSGVKLKFRGPFGWTPLQQAIYYKNIPLIVHIFRASYFHKRAGLHVKARKIREALSKMPDFQLEIDLKVDSFLPLINRLTPSDTLKIYKYKDSLRMDSTLVGYENFTCKRRDMRLYFNPIGVDSQTITLDKDFPLVSCNLSKQIYTNVLEEIEEDEMKLIIKDIMYSQLVKFEPEIKEVTLKEYTTLLGRTVTETLGEYEAKKYSLNTDYESKTEKRRLGERGDPGKNFEFLGSWSSYCEYEFRNLNKQNQKPKKNKKMEFVLWLTKQFPLRFGDIVDLLQTLGFGNELLGKLSGFLGDEKVKDVLLEGFPLKSQIPLDYALLYAEVQFKSFKSLQGDDKTKEQLFRIPSSLKYCARKQSQKTLEREKKRLLLANFYM